MVLWRYMDNTKECPDADVISDVMRAMGKRGAQKRWGSTMAGDPARLAHGAMLSKARKRAKDRAKRGENNSAPQKP